MAESLDINKLASILSNITDIDNEKRKENEKIFEKVKTLPKLGPFLLTIACNKDNLFKETVSHQAAIQLKNYIRSYWKYGPDEEKNLSFRFEDEEIIVISEEDKNFIRNNILEGLIYIVEKENIQILKQFNQCIKKLLKLDYNNCWNNNYINCIIKCINTQNQKVIYAGIILLFQLSKLFQFEDKEQQKNYNEVLIKINHKLLYFINECKGLKNNVEAMVIYKLIKIFFKSFQGDIPELFQTEEVFNNWSEYIVLMIKTPLDQQYIEDKKNIFWKLKHVCFQTLARIIQKYTNLDTKEKRKFQILLEQKYIKTYLDVFTVIYQNYNNNQKYVDDYGKACIYGFYTYLLGKKKYKEDIVNIFIQNDNLLEEIIKDSFMTVEDLEVWANDPKNYIAQKSQEINFFNSKRHKALYLVKALLNYKEKKTKNYNCYNKVFQYICNSMVKDGPNLEQEENIIKTQFIKDPNDEFYIKNPNNIPHCLKKESIIFLIKNNADIILEKSNDEDLEILIEKYILPELFSPCGLLREQSCDLISKFGSFAYKNEVLLEKIIRRLCELMQGDPQLSVKLYASMAIGSLFEKDLTKNLLKGNIKNIFEINLKLMEETDTEEIMDKLQEIVKYFTVESQQYIVQLSDYLIKYFDKIVSKGDNGDKQYMDNYALETNIINTFSIFIEYFINNPNIYPNIEKDIDKLLEYCLNNIYEKLEEGLDIIEAILKYSDTFPNHVWKFFIPLVESIIGSKEELDEFKKEFPNQIFSGQGYDSLLDISKIISIFIAKEPNTFIKMQDKNGVKYFDYVIKLIENIIATAESKSMYSEIQYSLRIINTLFDCYKGKIDQFFEQILKYILLKYKNEKIDSYLERYLQNLLAICFIYDPLKTLQYLQKNNCTKDIFIFWFKGFSKLEKIGDIKYNIFGICALISIDQNQQDKLIIQNIKQIIENIYLLIEKVDKKIKENEKDYNQEKQEDVNEEVEDGKEGGEKQNIDEVIKNILDGKKAYNDDEDLSFEEDDYDEKPLTNFDRQNPILLVKNTLNTLSQKNPEINKIIMEALGDNFNKLNSIINKEEQRLANKNNQNN